MEYYCLREKMEKQKNNNFKIRFDLYSLICSVQSDFVVIVILKQGNVFDL